MLLFELHPLFLILTKIYFFVQCLALCEAADKSFHLVCSAKMDVIQVPRKLIALAGYLREVEYYRCIRSPYDTSIVSTIS